MKKIEPFTVDVSLDLRSDIAGREDGFHLWLAKEKRALVDAAYAENQAAADRMKGRASSLLGWSVTLTTGALAATQYDGHRAMAWAFVAGFGGCAFCCIRTLYSTPWHTKNVAPEVVDDVLRDIVGRTEVAGTERMTYAIDAVNFLNRESLTYDRRWLKASWVLAAITPVVAIAITAAGSPAALKAYQLLSSALHP